MNRILLLLSVLSLSGCDHFPRYQYDIGSENSGVAERLCAELSVLAAEYSLIKRQNKREGTFCYYSESEKNNIVLGARLFQEKIVIDIQGFNHRKEIASLRTATEKMISSKFSNANVSANE